MRAANRKWTGLEPLERRTLLSAGPAVVDVMVLYTPAAQQEAGGQAAILADIGQAIADTNQAFANSHVHACLRLVYSGQANYSESGSLAGDLNALQAGSAAGLSDVPALRRQYGADLVSLWTGSSDATGSQEAGLAFQPAELKRAQADLGYNVVVGAYADNNYVFAHEIGHNLGAGHDRSDPTPRGILYAYGQTMSVGGLSAGDIMSNGVRIPYYSNPQVRYEGVATGSGDRSAHPADNAKVMNQIAPLVARNEPTRVADTAPPAAAMESVTLDKGARTLSLSVQFSDDSGILASSLRSSRVMVSDPGGGLGRARFAAAAFAGNVAQQSAVYRIKVPTAALDLSTCRFTLSPGMVRDVAGNVCGGGLLAPVAGSTTPWAFATDAGPRPATAGELGRLKSSVTQFGGQITRESSQDFYRFEIASTTHLVVSTVQASAPLRELIVNGADAQGQPSVGNVVADAQNAASNASAALSLDLGPGTYYLWVAPQTPAASIDYLLSVAATPQAL